MKNVISFLIFKKINKNLTKLLKADFLVNGTEQLHPKCKVKIFSLPSIRLVNKFWEYKLFCSEYHPNIQLKLESNDHLNPILRIISEIVRCCNQNKFQNHFALQKPLKICKQMNSFLICLQS